MFKRGELKGLVKDTFAASKTFDIGQDTDGFPTVWHMISHAILSGNGFSQWERASRLEGLTRKLQYGGFNHVSKRLEQEGFAIYRVLSRGITVIVSSDPRFMPYDADRTIEHAHRRVAAASEHLALSHGQETLQSFLAARKDGTLLKQLQLK